MTAAVSQQSGASVLIEARCDLCGSGESRHRYPLTRAAIVTCTRCGFSYVTPRPPDAALYEKLQQWAEQDVVDRERLRIAFDANTLKLYGRYLAAIEGRLPGATDGAGRRLLDVGCATGAFLTVAARRGWQVEGLELGRASSTYVRDKLECPVHNVSLYDFEAGDGAYDAVIFLEVIEHLVSPSEALRRIYRWLKPGGILLVSTPNFDSLYRRVHGAGWWVINCEDEHIMLFTPATLRAALTRAGYEVLRERIRGIDLPGILRNRNGVARANTTADGAAHGYYTSRSGKERLKSALKKAGMLEAVRGGLRVAETLFSLRVSPVYAMGEQLVFMARKPSA